MSSSLHLTSESDDGVKACCKFRLTDLSTATQQFNDVIGEGGFGKVYRGTLLDGTEVAVKRLDPLSLQVSVFAKEFVRRPDLAVPLSVGRS